MFFGSCCMSWRLFSPSEWDTVTVPVADLIVLMLATK